MQIGWLFSFVRGDRSFHGVEAPMGDRHDRRLLLSSVMLKDEAARRLGVPVPERAAPARAVA